LVNLCRYAEEYDAIRNELFLFDEEVGEKPEFVALNKVDTGDEASVGPPCKLNPVSPIHSWKAHGFLPMK
jgi:GTPase involved in cell partitioning and DNA repair